MPQLVNDEGEVLIGERQWTPDNINERIRRFFNNVIYCTAFYEETPTNKIPHYHCYIQFNATMAVSLAKIVTVFGWPAHLSIADIMWILYLDEDLLDDNKPAPANGAYAGITRATMRQAILEERLKGMKKISTRVSEALKTHTVEEVMVQYPDYSLLNLNKMKDFKSLYVNHEKITESNSKRIPFTPIDLIGVNGADLVLAKWINTIMTKDSNGHAIFGKKCHMWLCGVTNCGKSRFSKMLMKTLKVFTYNNNPGKWQDDFTGDYDLIVIEETVDTAKGNGFGSIQDMNQFMDGENSKINQKYKAPFIRTKCIPILFLANFPIEDFARDDPIEPRIAFVGRCWTCNVPRNMQITLYKQWWNANNYNIVNLYNNDEKFLRLDDSITNEKIILVPIKEEGFAAQQVVLKKRRLDGSGTQEKPVLVESDDDSVEDA